MKSGVPIETAEVLPWVWVLPLLFGFTAIVNGAFLILHPVISAVVIVQIVAISWVIGGILDMTASIAERGEVWGGVVVGGAISALAGLAGLAYPLTSTPFALALVFGILVASAFLSGSLDLVRGLAGPTRSWWSVALGVTKLLIVLLLLKHPIAGTLALLPIIGVALALSGILAAILAFQVRSHLRAVAA
jgi:uncharacterized membrane protein HdeD (DUF308 family)